MNEQIKKYVTDLGLPIFPVVISKDGGKTNKRPAVMWGKYQKELPTDQDLQAWNDYTAWGMATGELSHIVVVDVDMNRLEEAEAILGCTLTSSMMVHTGSGGTHIYYKWDEELRNTVKIEGAPIDFRGDGGYVVIPPTKSPWGEYTWFHEPNDVLKMMLPDLPKEIKALLKLNKSKVTIPIAGVSVGETFTAGERNAASTVAIRKLLGDIPQSQWGTTGWYAFNHWCKNFCNPPLDDYQIKATFDWWVRSNATDIKIPQGHTTMEIGIERIEERKMEKTAPITGYPMLDEKLKGWIPGHLYVFTGETNSGKTQVACNFAYKVFLQGKKVTYFALEPDVGVIEYIAGIHHKKRWDEISDENLKMDLPGVTIFTKEANMNLEKLVKTIQDMERQDLVIVDHIGYFTNNSQDRRSKTEQESEAIKRIIGAAKKKKTAILIIAHPRKPIGSSKKNIPLTMNEISGSASFKQDATDILILHMEKDPTDTFNLTNTFEGNILLPKVKTGKSGSIPIKFIPDSPIMIEANDQSQLPKIIEGWSTQSQF